MRKAKKIMAFLALTILSLKAASEKLDPSFTAEYFASKNVKQIVTFACWNEYDIFHYSRHIMNANTKISYNTIQDDLNMKNILKVNYYRLGVVLDLDCPQSQTIFTQFSGFQLPFNDSYIWLTVTRASEVPTTILNELPLTVESELTLALIHKSRYTMYDVYNHSYRHGGKLNVTLMGYWDKSNGLNNQLTQYKYTRRQNFHGLTLNFSTVVINEPKPDLETYLTSTVDAHIDSMSRYHYALAVQLRDIYNFKMNLIRASTWGYKDANGTFKGILGDMINGIVDVSAVPFQYLEERMDVCEFTVETWVVKLYFMFRHPRKNNVRNPFLKPFTQNVWWLVLNVSIICWILLLMIVKIENYFKSKRGQTLYDNPSSETALITIAAVSQQGLSDGPHMYSGRIVFITLFVWALLMYQFYSASIVGSLLAAPQKFINDVYDLANSDLRVVFEDTPYTRHYFGVTKDPASLYIYEKKMKSLQRKSLWATPGDGFHEMSKGGYAYFTERATGYKIIEDTFTQAQICEFTELLLVPPQAVTIVTSKHSPFKKMVIYGLQKIVEAGLMRRLLTIWQHRRPGCPESFRSQPVPVELHEFSPAMFMILGGLILGTIVMIGEYISWLTSHSRIDKVESEGTNSQGQSVWSVANDENSLEYETP